VETKWFNGTTAGWMAGNYILCIHSSQYTVHSHPLIIQYATDALGKSSLNTLEKTKL
jgi:hypothetical protein